MLASRNGNGASNEEEGAAGYDYDDAEDGLLARSSAPIRLSNAGGGGGGGLGAMGQGGGVGGGGQLCLTKPLMLKRAGSASGGPLSPSLSSSPSILSAIANMAATSGGAGGDGAPWGASGSACDRNSSPSIPLLPSNGNQQASSFTRLMRNSEGSSSFHRRQGSAGASVGGGGGGGGVGVEGVVGYFPPLTPPSSSAAALSNSPMGGKLLSERSSERLSFKGPMLLAERSLGKINSSPSTAYASMSYHGGQTMMHASSSSGGGLGLGLGGRSNLGLSVGGGGGSLGGALGRSGVDEIFSAGSNLSISPSLNLSLFFVPLQKLDLSLNPIGK